MDRAFNWKGKGCKPSLHAPTALETRPGRHKVSGKILIHSSWAWLDSYILWPNLQLIVNFCNSVVNLMPIFLNLPVSDKETDFFSAE